MKKKLFKFEFLYDCKQVIDYYVFFYFFFELFRLQSLVGEFGVLWDEGFGFIGQFFFDGVQFIIEYQVYIYIFFVDGFFDGLNKVN